jgi:hypothetical protein
VPLPELLRWYLMLEIRCPQERIFERVVDRISRMDAASMELFARVCRQDRTKELAARWEAHHAPLNDRNAEAYLRAKQLLSREFSEDELARFRREFPYWSKELDSVRALRHPLGDTERLTPGQLVAAFGDGGAWVAGALQPAEGEHDRDRLSLLRLTTFTPDEQAGQTAAWRNSRLREAVQRESRVASPPLRSPSRKRPPTPPGGADPNERHA